MKKIVVVFFVACVFTVFCHAMKKNGVRKKLEKIIHSPLEDFTVSETFVRKLCKNRTLTREDIRIVIYKALSEIKRLCLEGFVKTPNFEKRMNLLKAKRKFLEKMIGVLLGRRKLTEDDLIELYCKAEEKNYRYYPPQNMIYDLK